MCMEENVRLQIGQANLVVVILIMRMNVRSGPRLSSQT